MKRSIAALFLLAATGACAQEMSPALAALEADGEPHFVECAAVYFAAARGSPVSRYEALYSAGEYAFNVAILLRGREPADRLHSEVAARLMKEISNDLMRVQELEQKYGPGCMKLLGQAGYVQP